MSAVSDAPDPHPVLGPWLSAPLLPGAWRGRGRRGAADSAPHSLHTGVPPQLPTAPSVRCGTGHGPTLSGGTVALQQRNDSQRRLFIFQINQQVLQAKSWKAASLD